MFVCLFVCLFTEIMCAAPNIENAEIVRGQRLNYRINSRIKYKCHPGFEPEQPVHITCDSQTQWTGIQQCTEIMCAAPNIENAEIVGGQRLNYRINSRIKYKCRPGFEPEQPVHITCDSQTQWTGIQQCTEIMCAAPNIENAEIVGGQRLNYRINSRIKYKCRPGFEPEQPVHITCDSQTQWTGIQQCTEIMCAAPNIENAEIVRGQRLNYRINSRIKYKCHPGFEPEQPVHITCDSQTQWTGIQQCTEIMCAAPNIENAEIVGGQRLNYRINSRIKYKCRPGFEPEQPVHITCDSQTQWTGIQQCTEIMCAAPNIENAEIVGGQRLNYRINSRIKYKCRPGFEPEQPVHITCDSQTQWTGIQQCTEVTCQFESIITSGVKRIIPEGQTVFKVGENVEIICTEKHLFSTKETSKSFTCQSNGKWDRKPGCEITCEVPHDQQVSGLEYYFRGDMKLGAKRSYSCKSEYRKTAEEATCTRDGWIPKPLCAEMMCDPPRIPNAEIVGGQRINYRINSTIQYKCSPGFEPEQPVHITCDSQGQWTGIQQCTGTVQCSKPTKNLQFVTLSDEKTEYGNSESLIYTCKKPYNESAGGVLMCQNGNWNGTYNCRNKICPPPPYLQHGDYSIISTKDDVITAVSYTCQSYYVLTKQHEVYKCVDGKWETPPKCLRPCEIDDIVKKYNLQLPTGKVYIRHAEKYRLNCRDGWNTGSEMKAYVDVSCSDGNLQIDKSCDAQNNSK
ncbi:complement factor H-like isoform X4 [Onychostoma macrolepis]|uniref:complement factor H-like isoform X4 n=1 Tax=Onychostoma macrolepis TaxID=369639 RepID=UPI00272A4F31|nr:complement factor H-like isoform X4 [Onychostoma macrolepis]